MTSIPPEATPPIETPRKGTRTPLLRWTFALCIFTAGGFTFNELSNIFSKYTEIVSGTSTLGWGVISGIASIVGAVFYLIWSTISDNLRTRMGRRLPLMLIGGLSSSVLAILFTFGSNYTWLLIDGGILMAITRSMSGPSRSLTPDLIPQEKRGRINTLLTLMTNLGSVIFWIPALTILISGAEDSREINAMFILVFSVVFALSTTITVLLIREPPVTEPRRSWVQDLKKIVDYKEMAKNKDFLKILAGNLFVQAADASIFSFMFIFIENIFDTITFEVSTIAIAGPIVGVALGIGLYVMARSTDNIGRKITTLIGFLFAPIGAIIIAASGDILSLLIGFGTFFPLYLGGTSALESWFQDILPKEARGRFFGLINITTALGVALGSFISGAIGEAQILWIFVVSGVFLWVSIPFFMRVPETLKRKKAEGPKDEIPRPL